MARYKSNAPYKLALLLLASYSFAYPYEKFAVTGTYILHRNSASSFFS